MASRGADDVLVPFSACPPPAFRHLGITLVSWALQHPKIRYASSHSPAMGPRNELPSTTLLIPVERTSGKASGSCWRTKKYGCTQNNFLSHKQREVVASRVVWDPAHSQSGQQAASSTSFPLVSHVIKAWKQLFLELAWKKTKFCFCCFPMFT